jgi:hypothetical protein
MARRIFGASHDRGIDLIAAGCPLDYPEALPGYSRAQRDPFHANQLDGYAESRVYALGPLQTAYVIGLRLWTDRPNGTVISEWRLVPRWQDHLIIWDYDPHDIIPQGHRGDYMSVLDSRLMGVLNEHRLLRRGYPVEGLLCGCSSQQVPESANGLVSARVTLVDDQENTVALRIALTVIRRVRDRSKTLRSRPGRHLDRMDKLASDGG